MRLAREGEGEKGKKSEDVPTTGDSTRSYTLLPGGATFKFWTH
jgi:hypothetical protein